ncbi:MAG: hypothetical protein WCR56_03080 [Bacilli bacterium]|jgi:protein-export membrane protein SecD
MRRFLAYMTMMLTVIGVMIFNVQSVLENRNQSLEYGSGTQLVYSITKRDTTLYSNTNYPSFTSDDLENIDIENEIMTRLDTAGVRSADVNVINGTDNVGYQAVVTLAPLSANELSNVKEILAMTGSLSIGTTGDKTVMYAANAKFFDTSSLAEVTYNGTTPYPTINISSKEDYDSLQKAASSEADTSSSSSGTSNAHRLDADSGDSTETTTTAKDLYLWYDKTDNDTYDKAFGTNDTAIQEDVKKKVIAKLSTDNYSSDDSQITITSDLSGTAFTISTARAFVNMLNSTDYGFNMDYLYSNTVSANLATSGLNKTYLALGICLLVISILMIAFYGLAGLTSAVSMLLSLFLTLTIFSVVGFEFSIGGIVGFFVIMALSVLISSNYINRVRLEMKKGRDAEKANREGYHKAFFVNLDVSLVSLLTSLFCFLVAVGSLKTFFGVIMVGTLITFLITNYLDKWMTYWLVKDNGTSKLPFFGFKLPEMKKHEYVAKDKKSNKVSLITISAVSLGLLAVALPVTSLVGGGYTFFNNSNQYSSSYTLTVSFQDNYNSYSLLESKADYLEYLEEIGKQSATATFVTVSQEDTTTANVDFYYYPDSAYVNIVEKTNEENQKYYTTYFTVTVDRDLNKVNLGNDNTALLSIKNALLDEAITSGDDTISPGGDSHYITDSLAVGCYTTIPANLSHNTNNFFLVIFLLSVFAIIYTLIRYGITIALTQLTTGTLMSALMIGILSAFRLPFNAYTAFAPLAVVFILDLVLIPLLSGNKERLKEEGIKKTATMEQRALIENETTDRNLYTVIAPLASVLISSLSLFAIATSLLGVTATLVIGLLLIPVMIIGFSLPFYYHLATHLSFKRLTDFWAKFRSKKAIEKAKKEESLNKNGIPYVDPEGPHETIIPGMNDFQ